MVIMSNTGHCRKHCIVFNINSFVFIINHLMLLLLIFIGDFGVYDLVYNKVDFLHCNRKVILLLLISNCKSNMLHLHSSNM